jgi:hypothetical protein
MTALAHEGSPLREFRGFLVAYPEGVLRVDDSTGSTLSRIRFNLKAVASFLSRVRAHLCAPLMTDTVALSLMVEREFQSAKEDLLAA